MSGFHKRNRSQHNIQFSLSPFEKSDEKSILKEWLQNRFREYFLTLQIRESLLKEKKNYSSAIKIPKFDIMCHELRILDLKTQPEEVKDELWNNFLDIIQGVDPHKRRTTLEDDGYTTSVSHYTARFQKDGPHSLVETVNISLYAGEVDNIQLLELHPYISYSEKHAIDIHTKVFPMLESWAFTRNVKLKLPVPMCYFGAYQDLRKLSMEHLLSTENDIMSKVATAMSIDSETPFFESHRILILEDVFQNGFEKKNVLNASFLPLLNVKAALREIALIHCTSWAFSKITKNSFSRVWPFINHKDYLPYLMFLVAKGFPELIHHVEAYLLELGEPDVEPIIGRLNKLNETLPTTLAQITIPSSGPLCLIHQGLNFSSALFKHHLISLPSQRDFKANSIPHQQGDKPKQLLLIEREVCIVDWYNATYGSPMIDVAFLFLTGLPPKSRKIETSALLKLYWDEFSAIAKCFGLTANWNPQEIYKEYLHGLLYGCILISANVLPGLKPASECIEIFVEAIRDLIALNVI